VESTINIPWLVVRTTLLPPSIVDAAGVMVTLPTPAFCTCTQQLGSKVAGSGKVTVIAVERE
jgi:hypothetical protein